MTFEQFSELSGSSSTPPSASPYLKALWYDAKNDWEMAHTTIQDIDDSHAAWIHAYLHRKEGDIGNADYWYRPAGKKRPSSTLKEEWEEIARAVISI